MSSEKRKITADPKEPLFEGVKIIGPLLASNGFTFHFRDEGSGFSVIVLPLSPMHPL